jgi:hypothetical protein
MSPTDEDDGIDVEIVANCELDEELAVMVPLQESAPPDNIGT